MKSFAVSIFIVPTDLQSVGIELGLFRRICDSLKLKCRFQILLFLFFFAISQPLRSQEIITSGEHLFISQPIPAEIQERMIGKSMPESIPVPFDELRYLTLPYYDFENQIQIGEMVCNKAIANDLLHIFRALFEAQYQINSIKLIDDFGGSDDMSMAANNTSCFNYRIVPGFSNLSKHALGLAVDINPLQNPYVLNGKALPPAAEKYVDRSKSFPHKIDKKDLAYLLFTSYGFTWGGNWNTKDYQHFVKQ